MERIEWKNLNGLWDYAIIEKGKHTPSVFDGKILVPFAVESSLYRAQNEAYKKVDGEKRRKTLLIKELCVMAASGHAKRNVYMGLHCV